MSKPILGYWNLRGYCQPIRFILALLGIEVEEKLYGLDKAGFDEWIKDKATGLGLDFPNLPYYKEDGLNLTETRAIIKHLARKNGNQLMPTNPELVLQADVIENVIWEVFQALINRCYFDTQPVIDRINTDIPAKFEQLSKYLGNNKFFIGDKLSYVDVTLYEILHHFTKYDPAYLQPYPNLEQFKKNFEAIPAIANYIASPNFIKGPCHHTLFVKYRVD